MGNLSLIICLPLFGAFILSLIRGDEATVAKNSKNVALLITSINFLLTLIMFASFEHRDNGLQFEETYSWVKSLEATIHLGLDGLSIYFVVLTNLLMPICILASWNSIKDRVRAYMVCFLVLQSLVIGSFCALNLVLFYVFFEASLIPMFFIIGIWGGEERVYASFKLFLYTLFGSIFLLLAIIKIYIETGELDLIQLQNYDWPQGLGYILFCCCFISFAIKIPMWPLHTWLPLAHTQAPTAGSVILAGVLLKLGGYGILRLCIPIFPEASHFFAPYIIFLSLMAILYTSLVALVQTDMKKLIAYSSVAHMGFVTLGIFTFTPQGMSGAIVQMISHGLISAGLFLCIGVLYDRFHTRNISAYGGLYKVMPRFGVLFLILTLGSAGLPGTTGFLGEINILIGTFKTMPALGFLAALSMIFSAAYGLWLYKRLCLGSLANNLPIMPKMDLTSSERFNLGTLVTLIIYFGVHGQPLFGLVNPSVKKMQDILKPQSQKKKNARIDANADKTKKKVFQS